MIPAGTSAAGPTAGGRSERPAGMLPRLRDFWQRVTEGLELEQLWGQLKTEAKESYGLYSREVDWNAVKQHRGMRRAFEVLRALFLSMLMKLTPARRVLLLAALVLVVVQGEIRWGARVTSIRFGGLGALILFVLLALELADRVTMKRDLEIAREIQRWLVPDKPPQIPGVDIAFATRPANTVAGDYYDAFLRAAPDGTGLPPAGSAQSADSGGNRLLLVVADVAGKSVPAALLMATFQASLQTLAAVPGPLDELVAGLNRYACAHSLGGLRFTTAFLAEWDPSSGEIRYFNAGHNAPVLRHASARIERLEAGGVPLGISADASYEGGNAALGPGDLLVIFTDGLVEAENEDGEEYGESRLLQQLNAVRDGSAAETLRDLMADVDAFVGRARQHDDVTCLVFQQASTAKPRATPAL